MQELGISTLSALFCQANSDPKKGDRVKPSDFWYFKPTEEKDKINAVAADTFFDLVKDEKMPSWAVAIAPIEKLRQSKVNGSIPDCRAWIKRGAVLLSPQIAGIKVQIPLALIDGVEGAIAVIDIDSGQTWKVIIDNPKNETYWATDVELEIN